jgi:hypothetical protein
MKDRDHAIILAVLNEAAFIIADHFEPQLPRDPVTTVKRLIEVLEHNELAASIKRLEKGYGLRVVK